MNPSTTQRRPAPQRFSALTALLVAAACAMPALAQADAKDTADAERAAVALQKARQADTKARGQKAHYAKPFFIGGIARYYPDAEVEGVLRIWGMNQLTDGKLAEYWEKGFKKYHPKISFEWFTPTSLVAIPGLYMKKADIGVSRKITFDDVLTFQRVFGWHPVEIPVVTGSLDVPGWSPATTIVVNKANPIGELTFAQLDGIFGAEREGGFDGVGWDDSVARGRDKNIRTWGQLGLTGEWADKPIHVYGRPLKFHQQLQIERLVFQGGSKWNEQLREVPADGADKRQTPSLLAALANDPYGIAYGNRGTPEAALVKEVALAQKARSKRVAMTLETVQNRSYPLANENYFYINRKPGTEVDPKVREFIRYVLSREGQQEVMRDGKFLPLTDFLAHEGLEKVD